jgi:protocatechuate 3,4-dioxygenase beta subunit
MNTSPPSVARRRLVGAIAQFAALLPVATVWRPAQGAPLAATPQCGRDAPTAAQTEGPYFKPRSPGRTSLLEAGIDGVRLLLQGQVLTTSCKPVAGALLDLWHADAEGRYDNEGFRLRGHVFTDAQGRYRMETVLPGMYPGRTRHIHVKAQPPGGRMLTTQLYFPNEPGNRRDGLFDPRLLVALDRSAATPQATFDFVLREP